MNHKSIINLCLVSSRGPSKALLQEENINLIPVIVFSILKTNTILISVIINYYLEEARCVASLIAQDFAIVSLMTPNTKSRARASILLHTSLTQNGMSFQ